MEQVELKPCPFCGGEAELKEGKKGQAGGFEDIFVGECVACGCCNWDWHDSPAEAIAAWNTRTTDQAKDEEIARLRSALIECGRSAGAGLADDVSTDFLMFVPAEVAARIEKCRG